MRQRHYSYISQDFISVFLTFYECHYTRRGILQVTGQEAHCDPRAGYLVAAVTAAAAASAAGYLLPATALTTASRSPASTCPVLHS